ncbi:MAG: hypothetical protein ACOX3D_09160 [Syntrophomonadales bacterium]
MGIDSNYLLTSLHRFVSQYVKEYPRILNRLSKMVVLYHVFYL